MEDIEIRECDLPVEDFTNLADVALLLNSTKAGEVTYTVKEGDCWSVIAQDNNMTSSELLKLNPGYDIDKLWPGDVLLISNAVPYLTIVATQMEYYVAEIPYEIEYVDDDTMWEGDTSVISAGVPGAADTVARVTYQGYEEVERVIEEQAVITEPVTEVQARGTKERPSWAPTGSFRWPTSGTITSDYGYRNIFGGTSYHSGIDIANSYGTDIVASDGGEVIYAGWMSGYGYLVQIDHQNGYVTTTATTPACWSAWATRCTRASTSRRWAPLAAAPATTATSRSATTASGRTPWTIWTDLSKAKRTPKHPCW